jgi:hypothetical protein
MIEEVIVQGCGDCPFFQDDSDYGSRCNHPCNGMIGFKYVSFGYHSGYYLTPESCPLKRTDVMVKASESLKK